METFKKLVPIIAARKHGKGVTAAITEVMPERQGFRPWLEILEQDPELVEWLLETFPELSSAKSPTVTDKK